MKIIKKFGIRIDDVIWFPAENVNFLCQQVKDTAICVEVFPDSDKKTNLYMAVYQYNGKLFLIPRNARHIYVYDTKNAQNCLLRNSVLDLFEDTDYKYSTSLRWGNDLYLFGRYIPYVVKIDMCTEEIRLLDDLKESSIKKLSEIETATGLYFAPDYEIYEGFVWIPVMGTRAILQLALDSDEMYWHELPIPCCTICKAKQQEDFWIYSTKYDCVAKWNNKKGVTDIINSVNLHTVCKEALIECNDNTIKCISDIECVCINENTGQISNEMMQKSKEDILYKCEYTEEIVYKYLRLLNTNLFFENDSYFMGDSFPMYLKYIKRENKEKTKKELCFFGKKIYSCMREC